MAKLFPELKSAACVRRHPSNPVLSAKDIPYPADLIFNAGVVKRGGKYYMVFRNDYGYADERFAGTNIGVAESDDGVHWIARPEPMVRAEDVRDGEIGRIYDPRLTMIGDELFICFAVDTRHGIRGGNIRRGAERHPFRRKK